MAKENRSWGLGPDCWGASQSRSSGLIKRSSMFCGGTAPERRRTTTWAEFIRAHLAVLVGTDFFTMEVLTLRRVVAYYVLFFIRLESRKVEIARITTHPNEQWMKQMARNVTMERSGALRDSRYLLHNRDTKYTASFLAIIESAHVKTFYCSIDQRVYLETGFFEDLERRFRHAMSAASRVNSPEPM